MLDHLTIFHVQEELLQSAWSDELVSGFESALNVLVKVILPYCSQNGQNLKVLAILSA